MTSIFPWNTYLDRLSIETVSYARFITIAEFHNADSRLFGYLGGKRYGDRGKSLGHAYLGQ